jgi:CO/xanthine dehydrogenase FAD-binding subunit
MTAPGYVVARSVEEAVASLNSLGDGAQFVAGGTALQLGWHNGRVTGPLVDISRVDMGPAVSLTSRGDLRLAANATLEDVRVHVLTVEHLPVLHAALGEIAALGVRHLGTVGGNLCWRAGDLVPLLLALDASVELAAGTTVAIEPWLGRGERDLVAAIAIPARSAVTLSWCKVGARAAFSPSVITVAASFGRDGDGICQHAAFAVGGGVTNPQRLRGLEECLAGTSARQFGFEALALIAASEIRTQDDPLASAVYRSHAAGRILADFALRGPGGDEMPGLTA